MIFRVKKEVTFYEKPGCAGNRRQKALLESAGVEYTAKSILGTEWTKEKLEEFFAELEKEEIYNRSAPKIKSGEIDVERLSKEQLIAKMIEEPILIKRPLIEIDGDKVCGFDIPTLNTLLGTGIGEDSTINDCRKDDKCGNA